MTITPQEVSKRVQWKDLLQLTRIEIISELLLSLPWLVGSFVAYHYQYFILGLGCSFMFFLTALRQVHNAYHYALGISRASTEFFMLLMSPLMLCSAHAIQFNHLRHHRFNLSPEDIEAMSAKMPAWQALLIGPWFPIKLHIHALRIGSLYIKKWVYMEIIFCLLWVGIVFFVIDIDFLKYHTMAVAFGECLTSFFAVWTVHHHCDADGPNSRSIRNRFKAIITYNLFYHYEHHLFPAVPTKKLHIMAKRLDEAYPDLAIKKVF